jgi:phenylalanyl-tRNA synthetase beta chain
MRIPLSWLKSFISFSMPLETLAETLTLAGLEVDKIQDTPFSFSGVVVGEVLDVKPHPDAESLQIATVSDGKETFQVVCGAPNCKEGLKTAFAKLGAQLSSEDGSLWKIKKAKLRGVESLGMLCSEKELGLSTHHETIMDFPKELSNGTDLTEIFGDTIIEVSLTPNLGHCMSILGIARDLAAMIDTKIISPPITVKEDSTKKIQDFIQVEVKSPNQCPRYSCRLIRNVKVGPSPLWLRKSVEAAGIRSVNNIVDVTNYVMVGMGQPLHAFDYKKIEGACLTIGLTHKTCTLKTLDGEIREVGAETVMIYDQAKPLAIGGVIGGKSSEVDLNTSDILLEAADFDPSFIRKASKHLHLRTEASSRFERGIDREALISALDQAASLIQKCAGGEIVEGKIDTVSKPMKKKKIVVRIDRVNEILGTSLSHGEIEAIFYRLDMEVAPANETSFEVTVPSYRNDIHQEIDLIEEVARIYGYNHIEKRVVAITHSSIPHCPIYSFGKEARQVLLREGLQEFLTCDLISPELATLSFEADFSEETLIHVLHPSSVDQSVLRMSLLPGLLQSVKHNFDRQTSNLSAFEIGHIHFKEKDNFCERAHAAIIMTGKNEPYHYDGRKRDVDFFDLKGVVENVLKGLGIASALFSHSDFESFHPGKQAAIYVGQTRIGALGEVHPKRLSFLDLKQRIFFAQLDLNDLFSLKGEVRQMTPLPQFPGSNRDWTFTLKKEVPFGAVLKELQRFQSKLLKDFYLLDLYEDEKIGKGYKNITLRLIYRDDRKTLEQAQVEKEHERLIATLSKHLFLDLT